MRSELEYQEEVLGEYHLLFEEYYRRWCAENDIDIIKQEEQNTERLERILPKDVIEKQKYELDGRIVVNDNDENREEKKKFNKLYRKLAMELHPDKESGDEKRFARITEAYNKGEWSILLEEAIELGIQPENIESLIPLLKDEVKKIKQIIKHNKGIYSWKFYECEDDNNCKTNIIKKFLKYLFNLEIK